MAEVAPYYGTNVIKGAPTQRVKDSKALDSIQHLLQDPEWAAGMLEDIAELVNATGRSTENVYDDEGDEVATWGRH
jgi:hypothetical protein